MRPPPRPKMDYERVKPDEWLPGTIEEIEYNMEYKSTFEGKEKTYPAVRFRFKLDDYKFPHRSRWMFFGTGEKANLYKNYLYHLVEGAAPDMDFDLDALKGMRIKTMWLAKGDYDNLSQIRALDHKIPASASGASEPPEEALPF